MLPLLHARPIQMDHDVMNIANGEGDDEFLTNKTLNNNKPY